MIDLLVLCVVAFLIEELRYKTMAGQMYICIVYQPHTLTNVPQPDAN